MCIMGYYSIVICCLGKVEFDLAKLISDNSSCDAEDIDIEINQGTKFGTPKKPIIMWTFFLF